MTKLEQLQHEYNVAAAQLGDLIYRSRIVELDKGRLVKRMKEIQKEAAREGFKQPPTAPELTSVPQE